MIVKIGDEIDGVSIDTSAGGRLASWVMAGRERLLVEPADGNGALARMGLLPDGALRRPRASGLGRLGRPQGSTAPERRPSFDPGRRLRFRVDRHVADRRVGVALLPAGHQQVAVPRHRDTAHRDRPGHDAPRGRDRGGRADARRARVAPLVPQPGRPSLRRGSERRGAGAHARSHSHRRADPGGPPHRPSRRAEPGRASPRRRLRRGSITGRGHLAGHRAHHVLRQAGRRRGRAHAPAGRLRRVGDRLAGLDSTRRPPATSAPAWSRSSPARSWRRRRAAHGRSGPASSRPAGSSREAEPFGPFARTVPKPAWRRGVAVRPTISQPVRSRPGASRPLPARPTTAASPALLGLAEADGAVRCVACAHRCLVRPGRAGICRVRENRDGRLVTTVFGQAVAANADPIEKKPLFHVYPGSVCVLDRHARLQLPLPALPELDDLPGRAGRPERGRVQPASRRGRGRRPGSRFAQRRLHLHRADGLHRVRRRDCPTGHGRPAWPTSWSRTAIRPRRPWTCWRRSSRPPTST